MSPLKQLQDDVYTSHHGYIDNERKVDHDDINIGNVVRFMYDGEERNIFVVNANWQDKMHGLSLNSISHDDLVTEIITKLDTVQNEQELYTRILSTEKIKGLQCYRRFDINKIENLRKLDYYVEERYRAE